VLDGVWFYGREADADDIRGLIHESHAVIAWANAVAGVAR
jgi:hypothetical protein